MVITLLWGMLLSPVATMHSSDEQLMHVWVSGDVRAFETLYRRHKDKLYGFVYRQVRNGAIADELFQDIWQRIISAHQRWQPDASFSTWLYKIAHHRLCDYWRAQQHRPNAPTDAEQRLQALSTTDCPEQQLQQHQQQQQLHDALQALPDTQREVLLLRLQQSFSIEEIATITQTNTETVKSRLRYAMQKLRATLTQEADYA